MPLERGLREEWSLSGTKLVRRILFRTISLKAFLDDARSAPGEKEPTETLVKRLERKYSKNESNHKWIKEKTKIELINKCDPSDQEIFFF